MTRHVLALDVGTTTLRAHIYDESANIIGQGSCKTEMLRPGPGLCEMDPDVLWEQIQQVIHLALKDAFLEASSISCLGISVQRNTFITWDKDTEVPFHNFITWQDLRASDYVKQWNKSYSLWMLNKGGKLLHMVSRKNRFLAAAVLRFKSAQVTPRLKYMLDHNPMLQQRAIEKKVYFGCIETWLVWKLTKGEMYCTEYSCASATGIFDPFLMQWSSIVAGIAKIPLNMLPPIKDSSGNFGVCSADLFGAPIPITAIIADQQGAMFGQCCFNVGDVKCTMGTGTFIDCNTGSKPHASVAGLYPLIGWKYKDETVFLAEGQSSDTGQCLEWAKMIGLYENVEDTSNMALSVEGSNGVYFIPAFSGLQAPINDDRACASLVGINPQCSKLHILRAILESLAFRFKLLHDAVKNETNTELATTIRCDGGVCNNDFLVQLVSDLTGCSLDRPKHLDMSSLGAAFLAGLHTGIWHNKSELVKIRETQKLFKPQLLKQESSKYESILLEWKDAMKRSMGWYENVSV